MLMIFFLISVICFANLVFANQSDSKTLDENQSAFSKTEINTDLQTNSYFFTPPGQVDYEARIYRYLLQVL